MDFDFIFLLSLARPIFIFEITWFHKDIHKNAYEDLQESLVAHFIFSTEIDWSLLQPLFTLLAPRPITGQHKQNKKTVK